MATEESTPYKDYNTMTDEECLQAALDWVNLIRSEYGIDPLDKMPAGNPNSATSCVLAVALAPVTDNSCLVPCAESRYTTSTGRILFAYEGAVRQIRHPKIVNEFMTRFDRGCYPELVRIRSLD